MYIKTTLTTAIILTAAIFSNDDGKVQPMAVKNQPQAQTEKHKSAKRAFVDLVVYACTIDRTQAHLIALESLAGGTESAAQLYDALAELGKTEYVQRIAQPIAFTGEKFSVTSGASVPFVRGTSISRAGHTTAAVEYEEIGSVIKMSGHWNEAGTKSGTIQVEMEIQELRSSDIPLGKDITAPVLTQLEFNIDTAFKANVGQLFMLGGPPTGDEATVSILVGRLEVSE